MREKIKLDSSIQDLIIQMSEGNPGGITVLMQLLENDSITGMIDILNLDDMNIRGTQIWIGYKDYCNEDIKKFQECLSDRDQEMVNVINEQGRLGNHTEIAVCHGHSFN